MARPSRLTHFVKYVVVTGLFTACGGSISRSGDAGSAAGASASDPAGASGSCVVDDQIYADGASFPASDGCNTCTCQHGQTACTQSACGGFCQKGDRIYQAGETVPAEDGCNACTCEADGTVSCTLLDCAVSCETLSNQFQAAFERAKSCDPGKPNQCTKSLVAGRPCSRESFFNPAQVAALSAVSLLQQELDTRMCGGLVPCPPPCIPVRGRGRLLFSSGPLRRILHGPAAACFVFGRRC
jgi:hypothetical protein